MGRSPGAGTGVVTGGAPGKRGNIPDAGTAGGAETPPGGGAAEGCFRRSTASEEGTEIWSSPTSSYISDELAYHTRRIPFWTTLSGRAASEERSSTSKALARRMDPVISARRPRTPWTTRRYDDVAG